MLDNNDTLLPHITKLQQNGLTMTRAYTASPMCGTSRYSTMTGRYPSRSANSRQRNAGQALSQVTIPTTKLQDITTIDDGLDCSVSNMAALFQSNGYRTGMFGKWHLYGGGRNTAYDYSNIQDEIRSCGFDTAEAIYWQNLDDTWTNSGSFSHNMEHMVEKALQLITNTAEDPFFLYFNPTAPHASGNVYEALTQYSCRDAPEGTLMEEPVVPGMTEGVGCDAYRQSILDRAMARFGNIAEEALSNAILGAIWVDDAVGALMQYLEARDILDSTIFVFQLDHGQEGKSSLYEPGARIAQFVHYPDQIVPGSIYEGLVSTIDLAPTLTDYAGITADTSPGYYEMDGTSWKPMVEGKMTANDRCLMVELDFDRTVVCPCHKYLLLGDTSSTSVGGTGGGAASGGTGGGGGGGSGTFTRGRRSGLINTSPAMFDLCDDAGHYVSSFTGASSPEATDVSGNGDSASTVFALDRLERILDCHLDMTSSLGMPEYRICDDVAMGSLILQDDLAADDNAAIAVGNMTLAHLSNATNSTINHDIATEGAIASNLTGNETIGMKNDASTEDEELSKEASSSSTSALPRWSAGTPVAVIVAVFLGSW